MVNARASANLLKEGNLVVGDYVTLEMTKENGEYQIVKVEARSSEIFRVIVRESKKKVTASNCNLIVIVTSVSKPKYKRGVIDRLLVRALQWEIVPVLVFNKMDNYKENDFDIKFEQERLRELGVDCYEVSATDLGYDNRYLEKGEHELKQDLNGKTAVFLGQSGVGKSSLISSLAGGDVDLKVKEVAKKTGKGTHTTTWSELIDCGHFSLIDSPGIRSISIDDIKKEELMELFSDLYEISVKCKFKNCKHQSNSKGCAFLDHFENESIESLYIVSRLEAYQQMMDEVSVKNDWEKDDY